MWLGKSITLMGFKGVNRWNLYTFLVYNLSGNANVWSLVKAKSGNQNQDLGSVGVM